MPPPAKPFKRPADGSTSVTPTPTSPATPALVEAPGTPAASEPPAKKAKKAPKDQSTLTPLDKGRDMASKLLKKKADASELALLLQPLPYADALRAEMSKFSALFEHFARSQ